MFSKILVAYDGSDLSKKALKKAIEFFQQSSDAGSPSKLEVLHVFHQLITRGDSHYLTNTQEMKAYSEAILHDAKELVPSSVNVEYFLEDGDSARTILRHAEKNESDLIVIGSRGLGAIREFVLGSVSHNVAQHAKIPVLIVK